jgi:predicted peptidase
VSAELFLVLLAAAAPAANSEEAIVYLPLQSYFAAAQYHSKSGKLTLPYRLYVPKELKDGVRYPLVLWLHGEGASGHDNLGQTRHIDETVLVPKRRENCQFFILVPQKPKELPWFGITDSKISDETSGQDILDVIAELLDETCKTHPIDNARISLIGISSGGLAVWELGARFPDRFAAVLPFSSAPSSSTNISSLKNTPVWAFYSPTDSKDGLDATRQAIGALKSLHAPAAFTLSNDNPNANRAHFSWKSGFRDYELYDWLKSQSRGSENASLPGRTPLSALRNWNWIGPYATVAGVVMGVAVIFWASYREVCRHRRRRDVVVRE